MAKGHFLLGLLVGGAAAAVATRLLAPESGDEIRNNVNEKLDRLRDRMSDYADFEDDDLAAFDDVDGTVPSDLNTATDTDDTAETDAPTADDYPDINVDGHSAFAEAKDETTTDTAADAAETATAKHDDTTTTDPTDTAATTATPADAAESATDPTDTKKDDQPEA